METVHSKAISLQNQSQSALNTINSLNVHQYITTTVNPLLSRCFNYTSEASNLQPKTQTIKTQANLSLVTSRNVATSITELSRIFSVIPSIDMSELTTIHDNLLRVRAAFAALNIQNDLAGFRAEIEAMRLKIISYRLKINLFKQQIAAYTASYNSVSQLTCKVPSQIP